MNEHQVTELLERLVDPADAGPAPLDSLLTRGRRSAARRRGVVGLAAAAAVAVVSAGVSLLAHSPAGSPEPQPQPAPVTTAPSPTHEAYAFDDLIGAWRPVHLAGQPDPGTATEVGSISFTRGEVHTSHGCTYVHGPVHEFGAGSFSAVLEEQETRCLLGAQEHLWPDSSVVLRQARQLQLDGVALTFFGAADELLGTYQREWQEPSGGNLAGQWKPIRLYGEAPQPVDGGIPLLTINGSTFTADDGTNDTGGSFSVGPAGQWSTGGVYTTLVGCAGRCPTVRNPDVIQEATRVQLFDATLIFYDPADHVIGVYRRAR